ncbi:MAG TPA: rhomboid family intramembrane serine protease [Anaerolineales bacterium]|nr:rhomboid family intramembrane serine protease [Anaerolineales bacterium]
MFPIGDDDVQGAGPSLSTWALLIVNVLVFLFEASMSTGALETFIVQYGVIPREIVGGVDWQTLVTSMFLHGGWLHLIGNMLFLYVFSNNIEAVLGTPMHFLFYMAGGVVASLAHIFSNPGSGIPSVGASGAIAAILGAYLVLFPRSRVKLLVFMGYNMGVTRASAVAFLGLWAVMQLFSGVASLGVPTAQAEGVAWWAHIGGFAFGLLIGWLLRGRVRRNIAFTG